MERTAKIRLRESIHSSIRYATSQPKITIPGFRYDPPCPRMWFAKEDVKTEYMPGLQILFKPTAVYVEFSVGGGIQQTVDISYSSRTMYDIATKLIQWIDDFVSLGSVIFTEKADEE